MLKWPDAQSVEEALRCWTKRVVGERPDVVRIGYFGSYARGDWGVGSDLDLIVVVERSDRPFVSRGAEWDTFDLPVPTDLLIYTEEEWGKMEGRCPPETRWLYRRSTSNDIR